MPKIWKTDEDLVGYEVPIKGTDRFYKVLPWDGDITPKTGTKLFPIYCEVCSQDKELFPNKILIRKGDIKAGCVPCGCAKSHKYSCDEIRIICERLVSKAPHISLIEVTSLNGTMSNTKLTTHCSIHDMTSYSIRYPNVANSGGHLCKTCGREAIIKSKVKTPSDLKATFKLQPSAKVFLDETFNSGVERSWLYFCDICSYDKYVKSGVCSGTFKAKTGFLQAGGMPCRCTPYYRVPYDIAMYDIEEVCTLKGYTFEGWIEDFKGGSTLFKYKCASGHINTTNHKKFVTDYYGCIECCDYGFYRNRLENLDYLYIIKLENENEMFYKIGRSFHPKMRYSYYKKYYDLEEIFLHKDVHNKIYPLEQDLHKRCSDIHYTPEIIFSGCKYECFNKDFILIYKDILEELNSGVYTREQHKNTINDKEA